jgi:hypothetical protein
MLTKQELIEAAFKFTGEDSPISQLNSFGGL